MDGRKREEQPNEATATAHRAVVILTQIGLRGARGMLVILEVCLSGLLWLDLDAIDEILSACRPQLTALTIG
ncbi:uncharacterized protein ColSpa_03465 [Colletotrichum spaethianum]|uniref:Uncharacterized protein n=1 Tax=Colletotrichum spaethianum TaxID=700344 RepID=A0AA37L9P6_9PEZI|nr:uncharacterized protein ColSpa_03465 [Colletotrichum spaethianum]GKT43284.1 hypothetical protein ColSpa_03465 [Colletotrichum spaethianum]